MPQAQDSVTIKRPVELVFAYVADGERCPEWRPGVLDITRLSGEGAGTIYSQGVKGPMGRRIAADYQITAFEPNRLIEFQTIAGPARPHGRYGFEETEAGTRVTFSLDAELTGLKRLFMASAVQNTMNAEVRALDRLKQVLESKA
jgi:uncharacterized protein YndB with AHSA1/START domain